jgi:hypothetical protein
MITGKHTTVIVNNAKLTARLMGQRSEATMSNYETGQ